MEIVNIIIEFLKIFIWPVVVIIIFYVLREPIKKLLQDIRGVKYGDASILLNREINQETNIDKSKDKGFMNGNADIPISKTFLKFSEETREAMSAVVKKATNFDNLDNYDNKIKALSTYSAAALLYIRMQSIYQSIYGSQIRILQKLNGGRLNIDDIKKVFYDNAKNIWPELYDNYSFEKYLDYLKIMELVIVAENNQIVITIFGRDFLRFIIEEGYSVEKPF